MHISEYVVYMTGESRGSLSTSVADVSDEGAVYGSLYEGEDMLHAASNPAFNERMSLAVMGKIGTC